MFTVYNRSWGTRNVTVGKDGQVQRTGTEEVTSTVPTVTATVVQVIPTNGNSDSDDNSSNEGEDNKTQPSQNEIIPIQEEHETQNEDAHLHHRIRHDAQCSDPKNG
jgi:hypothetical protein